MLCLQKKIRAEVSGLVFLIFYGSISIINFMTQADKSGHVWIESTKYSMKSSWGGLLDRVRQSACVYANMQLISHWFHLEIIDAFLDLFSIYLCHAYLKPTKHILFISHLIHAFKTYESP